MTAQAEGRSLIVLDALGSMWGQIDGRAKLDIARDALASVLAGVDPASELRLMADGHRQKGTLPAFNTATPSPSKRPPKSAMARATASAPLAAAGDDVVEAERGDTRSDLPVPVKAGERIEVTLPQPPARRANPA
jgi:hypothetical protein